MTLVCDIETDGLLDRLTRVHSLTALDPETGEIETYSDQGSYKSMLEGLKRLTAADLTVWHNGLCFDLPALRKVYPDFTPGGEVLDTLVCTRLFWPDLYADDCAAARRANPPSLPPRLYGSHSLEAWGHRLGVLKDPYHEQADWQEWSEQLCAYNRQDTRVTHALYQHIRQTAERDRWPRESIQMEHDFRRILFKQEQTGFPFNEKQAAAYYAQLSAEREKLTQQLQAEFPPADRGEWFTPKANNAARGYVKGQPVWKPKPTPFNPASRQDIADRLKQKYGWEPDERTETGAPKVDDEILTRLDYPEAKQIARYLLIQKRIGQLAEGQNAWLKLVAPDGRIHGQVNTNGAVTGRCTHANPNMAQVPSVGVYMGKEFRSLFYAPEGWTVLGADASGLELRCLAHYMARYDDGAYAQKILSGDIHWANAQALGLVGKDETKDPNNPSHLYARKVAKRYIYGYLYGAGDHKLGEVLDLTPDQAEQILAHTPTAKRKAIAARLAKQNPYRTVKPLDIAQTVRGEEMRETFLASLPAMKQLIDRVRQTAKERGHLRGLDGRRLPVRSLHTAFNTLLQSAGAIAVKKATCILWELFDATGLDKYVEQVAHVHDEYQLLVPKGREDEIGKIAVIAFRLAGEHFHLRIPLDGEYKYGPTWADTH